MYMASWRHRNGQDGEGGEDRMTTTIHMRTKMIHKYAQVRNIGNEKQRLDMREGSSVSHI